MSSILVLEDNDERIASFRKVIPGAVFAKTVVDLIPHFQNQPIDLLLLDHDLGGETYVDTGREDCGMEIVRWIESHMPQVRQVIVHSWNFPAAREMQQRLKTAGYFVQSAPFSELLTTYLKQKFS